MADPTIVAIPLLNWVLVATGVTNVNIEPTIKGLKYLQTTRDNGNPAPTNGDYSDAAKAKELPYDGGILQTLVSTDVYVAVRGRYAGKVRVTL